MVVWLRPLPQRLPQECLRLVELLLTQPVQHGLQLGHLLVLRLVLQPRPSPPRHLPALRAVPQLVQLLAELPQRLQLGQVGEQLPQIGSLLLVEVLLPLDDQVPPLEHERRLLLVAGAPALGPLLGPLLGSARFALAARLAPPL